MILGMSNIAWSPEDRFVAYAMLAEAGAFGLEVAPGMLFSRSADPLRPEQQEERRALAEIAGAGLSLVSMQSLLFGVENAALFGSADARMRFRDGMERAIELAGRLSVPNLVFGSPLQRRVPDGVSSAQARTLAAETFHALGQRAAAVGTVIAIEANPETYGTNFLNTLEEASSFVADLGHPSVRLVLDLGEMLVNGTTSTAVSRIPGLVTTLNHVHVSEPHLAPAPADLGVVGPILNALYVSGYSGAVSIEMKRPQGGLDILRQSLGRLRAAAPHGACR